MIFLFLWLTSLSMIMAECHSFSSRGQIPLPWLGSNDALPLATRMETRLPQRSLACYSPWGSKEWDMRWGDGFCWRATLPPLYQLAFAVLTHYSKTKAHICRCCEFQLIVAGWGWMLQAAQLGLFCLSLWVSGSAGAALLHGLIPSLDHCTQFKYIFW